MRTTVETQDRFFFPLRNQDPAARGVILRMSYSLHFFFSICTYVRVFEGLNFFWNDITLLLCHLIVGVAHFLKLFETPERQLEARIPKIVIANPTVVVGHDDRDHV